MATTVDAGRRRRVVGGWWIPLVAGVALIVVAAVLSSGDLHWWLLTLGAGVVMAAVSAVGISALGPERAHFRAIPRAARRAWIAVCLGLAIVGALCFREASGSGGASPSVVLVVLVLVPGVLAATCLLIMVVVLRMRAVVSRVATFLAVGACLLVILSAVALVGRVPFSVRLALNESAMTAKAESLIAKPDGLNFTMSAERSMAIGIDDATAADQRLGDFEVNAVAFDGIDLDRCTNDGPGGAGLRFWLGTTYMRSLLYCPNRVPEAGDIHTAVDHVDGPWYLEYDDN